MRVGLNATCFNDRPSGARQRFVGIYRELVRLLPETEFVVYEPHDARPSTWLGSHPNVRAHRTPIPSEGRFAKLAAGAAYWPFGLRQESLDLLEAFHLPLVRRKGTPTVLTIHDIRGVRLPSTMVERTLGAHVTRRALRESDLVVTVSSSMRDELLAFEPGARVEVVHNGIDASLYTDPALLGRAAELRRRLGLPAEFVLSVGHFEPRKNYERLLRAMALLRDAHRPMPLVLVGNDSGSRRGLESVAHSLGLGSSLRILSGLDDEELRALYLQCSVFVFPSLYEGFGIPLLEAMAARKPIAMSALPVFLEITQGQGRTFDPLMPDQIATAILSLLESSTERELQSTQWQRRVLDFSYAAIARRVAEIYSEQMRA